MIAGGASLAPSRWSWPGVRDRRAQQRLVLVDRLDHRRAEEQELQVLLRRVARLEQVQAGVGAHRPVVVLARPVHARERLLVQQAHEAIAARGVLQDLHRQHLMVGADVRVLEDRRDLVLVGRDLVVARLDRHAELRQLDLALEHVRQDALGDRAEVVVVELVALRRLGAEQRAPGRQQVGALEVVLLVDQEVLLLAADRREHALRRPRRRAAPAPATAAPESASIERSSGILWSSASPVHEVNAVGMHSSAPLGFSRMNAGEVGSQAV